MPGGPPDRPWPILQDYPSAVAEIGDRWNDSVWAIGSLCEDGTIRSLAQWNHHAGMLTFAGSSRNCRPGGYVGGDPVETTIGELLAWAFQRSGFFVFDQKPWVNIQLWPVYESEMWRIRNWGEPRFSPHYCEESIVSAMREAIQALDRLLGRPA